MTIALVIQGRYHSQIVGRTLRRKVEKEYTWEKVAERVEGVYRRLISNAF